MDVQESQANPEENVSPAEVQSHVQRRVRRIAEQAFWDSVQATLAEPVSGVSQQQVTGQLAGLLSHMGQELMAVLPVQATAAREQLAAELDEGRLQEALSAHQVSLHCYSFTEVSEANVCIRVWVIWEQLSLAVHACLMLSSS